MTRANYTKAHSLFSSSIFSALDDAIRLAKSKNIIIPFGVGIAGVVAESKEVINIKNAYEDPRFNDEIDQKTGYKTNTILSMPICNYEGKYIQFLPPQWQLKSKKKSISTLIGDVIGVAQIINKTNGELKLTRNSSFFSFTSRTFKTNAIV